MKKLTVDKWTGMNSLIFQNPCEFFQYFVNFLKKKFKIFKNEQNFMNFGYAFVRRFYITLKNFSGIIPTVSRL